MHIDILYIDGIVTDYNKQFYFEDDCAFGIAKSKTIDDFKTNIFNLLKANRNVLWEELTSEESDTKHAFLEIYRMFAPYECAFFKNENFEVICPDSYNGREGRYTIRFEGFLTDYCDDLCSERIVIRVIFDRPNFIERLIYYFKRPSKEEYEKEQLKKEIEENDLGNVIWD